MNGLALHSAEFNMLSVCAGAGGLDLGVEIARSGARSVCYVERELYAASTLAGRMEEGSLAPAPIWDDLGSFDGRRWRGLLDCIISGDPCQPNSVAGKRAGSGDDRWLIDQLLRVVDESRPDRLFRENVTGNADGQLEALVGPLERMGYRVAAGIFSAAEVGASHKRERLFIMADANGGSGGSERQQYRRQQRFLSEGDEARGRDAMADSDSRRSEGERQSQSEGIEGQSRHESDGRDGARPHLADAGDGQLQEPRRRSEARTGLGSASSRVPERTMADAAMRRRDAGAEVAAGQIVGIQGSGRQTFARDGSGGLSDSECDGEQRWRDAGDIRQTEGEAQGSRHQRQRDGRHALDRGSAADGMADAGVTGSQGSEFGGACDDERHRPDAYGSAAEFRGTLLFAPWPSDAAWPLILDADPLLAPAIGEIDLWSVARRNLGFPPLVGTIGRRGGMARDLDPTAAAQVKSEVRRIADGLANRLDRLRLCGNGVFPLAVAVAWLCLELTLEQAGSSADSLVRAA